ncbi:MAG: YchF/TatD family DNA exonuclease [Magnetococcales bacterium]|nr:YchF/TatD family DNA exonuclease [Magnetococcales bacterium]
MIRLADSHAHLNFPDFQEDLEAVLQRAEENGVAWINSIATRPTDVEPLLAQFAGHPGIHVSAGIHPHYAAEFADVKVEEIVALCRHADVVAVGETGLDFHYEFSPPGVQEGVFRRQIRAAREAGLPLVIHTREAEEATRRVMSEEGAVACGGVLHCFTGTEAMARWALDQGFYLSFSGIVTFRTASALQEIVRWMPLERLLIETDAPYLAPVPVRGKRNEPAYVRHIAEFMATLLDRPLEEIARIITENHCRLFRVGGAVPRLQPGSEAPLLAYPIGRGLYLNITRACTLRCTFCPKWSAGPRVHDYDLTLPRHPTANEVLAAMGDFSGHEEIVFCGFGEPTLRLEVLLEVARKVKEQRAIRVRINTDGLANRVYGMDVTPRLRGLIDAVSVSLNAQDEVTYNRICQPGMKGSYPAVLDFLRAVAAHVPDVTATAIQGVPGVDVDACRRIAEGLGVKFRVRYRDALG